jgi:hypothetical protein
MVDWDFRAENPDRIGKFDFNETNFLDQAMQTDNAFATWAGLRARAGSLSPIRCPIRPQARRKWTPLAASGVHVLTVPQMGQRSLSAD